MDKRGLGTRIQNAEPLMFWHSIVTSAANRFRHNDIPCTPSDGKLGRQAGGTRPRKA